MAPAKANKLRRGRYYNYDDDRLEQALECVARNQLSVREAAERYGVPKSTICDKYRGKHGAKNGRPAALNNIDEKNLVAGVLVAAKWGYPLTGTDVKTIVKSYLERLGKIEKRFKNSMPGPQWLRSFMARHKNILSVRLSENIKRARAAVSKQNVVEYFDNLTTTLQDVPASHVVHYDETNITDDPGQQKVLVRRGAKHANMVLDTSKSSTSVMFAVSADGNRLPIYIVYKFCHLHDTWTQNGPKGAFYNRSSSEWFDSCIIEDWFEKVALKYFKSLAPGKRVLIGDNLASHTSIRVINLCHEHNIQFVLIPANATHLCQPLDVAYFRPLKMAWKSTLLEWKKRHRGAVPKEYFPQLLRDTMLALKESENKNIQAGFRACGIFPLDRSQVLKRIPDGERQENNGPAWCATFEEHISQSRQSDTAPKRQRRKRLRVEAGKAVTAPDLNPAEVPYPEPDEEIEEELGLETENEENLALMKSAQSEVEGSYELEAEADIRQKSEGVTVENKCLPVVGDLIVCKFIYNADTKKEALKEFVSKVVAKMGEDFEVSCLREKSKFIYVFLPVEDLNDISPHQICSILALPQVFRGKFVFTSGVKTD